MKGNVLRPQWPAPANNKTGTGADADRAKQPEPSTLSRITLALLDEYSTDSVKNGYDPYNTDAGKRRDVWRRKPKRD